MSKEFTKDQVLFYTSGKKQERVLFVEPLDEGRARVKLPNGKTADVLLATLQADDDAAPVAPVKVVVRKGKKAGKGEALPPAPEAPAKGKGKAAKAEPKAKAEKPAKVKESKPARDEKAFAAALEALAKKATLDRNKDGSFSFTASDCRSFKAAIDYKNAVYPPLKKFGVKVLSVVWGLNEEKPELSVVKVTLR